MLESLVIDGLDDWNDASWVAGTTIAGDDAPMSEIQAKSLAVIAHALFSGLVTPGDVGESGFAAWDLTPSEAFERICREWLEEWSTELPTPGAIVWLDNTALGDDLARSVLARERRVSG